MAAMIKKRFDSPEETRNIDKGKVAVLNGQRPGYARHFPTRMEMVRVREACCGD